MTAYTDKLKLKHSALGAVDWKDEEDSNRRAIDSAIGSLLTDNKVISGCGVVDSGGLFADVAAGRVRIGGQLLDVAGVTLELTAGEGEGEQQNWVYIDDSGTPQASPVVPSGTFLLLAVVDTSDADVLRIADVRPMGRIALIEQDKIFYVDVGGDDITGDGSLANPFYSVNGAMQLASNYRLINDAGLTIRILDGTYYYTSVQILNHPDGAAISVIGNNATPANVSINAPDEAGWEDGVFFQLSDKKVLNTLSGMSINSPRGWEIGVAGGASIVSIENIIDASIKAETLGSIHEVLNSTISYLYLYSGAVARLRETTVTTRVQAMDTARLWLELVTFTSDETRPIWANDCGHIDIGPLVSCTGTPDVACYAEDGSRIFLSSGAELSAPNAGIVYSPALTTSNTPVWGNGMAIIIFS